MAKIASDFQHFPDFESTDFRHPLYLDDNFINLTTFEILGVLAFENYSSNSKDLCPRQRSSTFFASIGDSLMSWAVHDFLWYFLGISAIFVAKDYLSPEYIQVCSELEKYTWSEDSYRLRTFFPKLKTFKITKHFYCAYLGLTGKIG